MYLKKTLRYGNRIEVRNYHAFGFQPRTGKRQHREKPTPEAMKAANERRAKRKLFRLLAGNFTQGDHFLTLTYRKDTRPDADGAREALRKFIRKLRRAFSAAGQELKYIITTEWKGRSIHHHIVVNDLPGFSKLAAGLWIHGGIHDTPLYPDGDYMELAEYLIKETRETFREEDNPYRQRYTCSRNLKKPEEKTEVVRASSWRETPKVPPRLAAEGWQLDKASVYSGVDVFGYGFQEYMMIRRTPPEGNRRKKEEGCR